MPYSTHNYTFNALTYVDSRDAEFLSNLLRDQGLTSRFDLTAHRRRGTWGTTVPPGIFENDLRPTFPWDLHTASRDRITTLVDAVAHHGRRAIPRSHDVLEVQGALFYHPEGLRIYARHAPHGAFLTALARFLEQATKNPLLIAPARPRSPYVPHAERVATYGHAARGPRWTPLEDAVLRRWFGPRTYGDHAGKHARLTEHEWTVVLGELPLRNRKGVHDRIVELNRTLQHEFFRDGFVAIDQLPKYMARVLGERPRVPIRPKKRRRRL